MSTEYKAVKALPIYVTLSEVHRMLACCDNDRDRLLIRLLWYTGGRISEVINARAGDITKHGIRLVNLKQGRWKRNEDGSRQHIAIREEKHVLLPKLFLEELKSITAGKSADTPLIGRRLDGKIMSRQAAWQIFTRIAASAGVIKKRFRDGELRPAWCHLARHGYAVLLLENGLPVTVAQRQLGHKSLASTQVYSQISDPRTEELLAAVQF